MIAADTIIVMEHTPASLAELFQAGIEGDGSRDQPVGDVVSDSRLVATGDGFIALPGERDDGHRHVTAAGGRGAALAIVRRAWPRDEGSPPLLLRVEDTATALRRAAARQLSALGCTVVGITGSVGKTTVKEMCVHVLAGRRAASTTGNLNTWTGVPLSLLRTAPPVDVFVAEMAMSGIGEIRDLVSFTRPRIAAVLNVGLAHVGLLGSIDAIARAKSELLECLPEDGVAVLNADDPRVVAMAHRVKGAVVWFGVGGASRDLLGHPAGRAGIYVHAEEVRLRGLEGSDFVLHAPGGCVPVRFRVPGEHAVRNACAAAAIASQLGVDVREAGARLETFRAPARRGRILAGRGGSRVLDDCYNSSPSSLAAALDVLGRSGARHRVAILGDMLELGDAAEGEHRLAGRRAAAAATALIAVGVHGELIREGAIEAGMAPEAVVVAPDAAAAVALMSLRSSRAWSAEPSNGGAPPLGGAGPETVFLVKGSNAVGLDRVVEALT